MDYNTAKFLHLIGIFIWTGASSSLGLFLIYITYFNKKACNQNIVRNFYRWMTNLEIAGILFAILMAFFILKTLNYKFNINWINKKLMLVLLFILPLESINFYFVNFYIPKHKNKEKAYKVYDAFVFIITLPLIFVSLYIFYLAIFKPD